MDTVQILAELSTANSEIARLNAAIQADDVLMVDMMKTIDTQHAVIRAMAERAASTSICYGWQERRNFCFNTRSTEECKQCIINHFTSEQEAKDVSDK